MSMVDLMKLAGLTHGSFSAYRKSREFIFPTISLRGGFGISIVKQMQKMTCKMQAWM